ncbi:hypothetical protein DC522_20245 [Microvirga sp. KLBC 81]|nr:hypothetical protein DC522_20245 [Microvirga sp. KLBC 81]
MPLKSDQCSLARLGELLFIWAEMTAWHEDQMFRIQSMAISSKARSVGVTLSCSATTIRSGVGEIREM